MGMTYLEAKVIATKAHRDQTDKLGEPYIDHPIAVAAMFEDPEDRIVAVLHDVPEDSDAGIDATLDGLIDAGLDTDLAVSLDCLSHRPGESRQDYIERVMSDPTGRAERIKRADIRHNTDPERVARLSPADQERGRNKYARDVAQMDLIASRR